MFAPRFFATSFFAPRYFPPAGDLVVEEPTKGGLPGYVDYETPSRRKREEEAPAKRDPAEPVTSKKEKPKSRASEPEPLQGRSIQRGRVEEPSTGRQGERVPTTLDIRALVEHGRRVGLEREMAKAILDDDEAMIMIILALET